MEAETGGSWIPGLALLARNDGLVVFVIPAKAGIQGVRCGLGILFLSSGTKQSLPEKEIASSLLRHALKEAICPQLARRDDVDLAGSCDARRLLRRRPSSLVVEQLATALHLFLGELREIFSPAAPSR